MSKVWSGGSTREWRRLRADVLEANRIRNGGVCQANVIGLCQGIATQVHHTLGRSVTGDDPRFMACLCGPCNIHIGDPQTHPRDCARCENVAFGPKMDKPKPRTMTKW